MLGVTIASLTGSDSAPAKANEAKQANDVGAMKDEISLVAQNAQMDAYNDVYVDNNSTVTRGQASTVVGQKVIDEILKHFGKSARGSLTGKIDEQIERGNVTIRIEQAYEDNAKITVSTTDVKKEGTIAYNGGLLTWNDTTPVSSIDNEDDPIETPDDPPQEIEVHIGDVISYSPSGTYVWNKEYATYDEDGTETLSSAPGEDFNVTTWIVMNINGDDIEMIPAEYSNTLNEYINSATIGTVELAGAQGYNNGVKLLNDACSALYKNESKRIEARSINIKDMLNCDSVVDATPYGKPVGEFEFPFFPMIFKDEYWSIINNNKNTGGLKQSEQERFYETTEEGLPSYYGDWGLDTATKVSYNDNIPIEYSYSRLDWENANFFKNNNCFFWIATRFVAGNYYDWYSVFGIFNVWYDGDGRMFAGYDGRMVFK